MRILELNLIAYGRFTDTVLDFSAGSHGLHIVYGENEAGKSTALSALHQALYGIEARTPYDFLHPYRNLRVGVHLEHSGGSRLAFVRRKGNKRTLRTRDDAETLDESTLAGFLSGVGKEHFATMFGIGYDDLVEGGRLIVSGEGGVGGLLFSAGSGISSLRRVQKSLEQEAEDLFKPQGRKPALNQAISEYRRLVAESGSACLSAEIWAEHKRLRDAAAHEEERAARELADLETEKHRLERIRQALKDIGKRREIKAELESMKDTPRLRPGFSDEQRRLERDLAGCRREGEKARNDLEKVEAEARGMDVPVRILERGAEVVALFENVGNYADTVEQKQEALAEKTRLEKEARAGLSEAGLVSSNVPASMPDLGQKALVDELIEEHDSLRPRLEMTQAQTTKLERRAAELARRLESVSAPESMDALKAVWADALEHRGIDDILTGNKAEENKAARAADLALRKLPRFTGTMEELEQLPLPDENLVVDHQETLDKADSGLEKADDALKEARERLEDTSRQLDSLVSDRRVPAHRELDAARDLRKKGWHLVRSTLEGSSMPEGMENDFIQKWPGVGTLPDAFEKSMENADDVADTLREAADLVARRDELETRKKDLEKRVEDLTGDLEDARRRRDDAWGKWVELWRPCGVEPESPARMRSWLVHAGKALDAASRLADARTAARSTSETVTDLLERLRDRLSSHGISVPDNAALAEARELAREALEEAAREAENRRSTEKELESCTSDLADTRQELAGTEKRLDEWREKWIRTMEATGLPRDMEPAQAKAVLERIREVEAKQRQAERLAEQLARMEERIADFTRKARDLAGDLAQDLVDLDPERMARELHLRLERARELDTRKKELDTRRENLATELDRNREEIARIQAEMEQLCREAGCDDPLELDPAIERAARRKVLEDDLWQTEDRLRNLSGGLELDRFVEEALAVDPDRLIADIGNHEEKIRETRERKDAAIRDKSREETVLSTMTGSDRAAELAQEAQQALARVESKAVGYARLKLAGALLARAVERYRERSQNPVLDRASGIFARITNNAYTGLVAGYDDRDEPALFAKRLSGEPELPVSALSEGTADQLYLAVRLASVEAWTAGGEPMPFVVDDILVKFDNDRAAAALKVLADLSDRVQVIFFTHHRHLVDLAREHVPGDRVFFHDLPPAREGQTG
ncbi:MAG: AAA family ATPase [Desulfatibacillaceae bacterium]